MFTGIIQEVGKVLRLVPRGGGRRVFLRAPEMASKAAAGDSVCVSGVCLTVTTVTGEGLEFDIGAETTQVSTLGSLRVGLRLNLEPALSAGDPMGGHLVSGHVDGIGKVVSRRHQGETVYLTLSVPRDGAGYVVPRGSIGVDGVSLTVTEAEGERVSVALIPYTLENTTLGHLRIGEKVNVEFDVLAKYAQTATAEQTGLTLAALEEDGF